MNVFLAGDFNIDILKCNTHSPTNDFVNTLTARSFLPTINVPTRVSDSSSTLIDNIFARVDKHTLNAAVICSDISDHYPILTNAKINTVPRVKRNTVCKKRIFSPDSINKFNADLQSPDLWHEVIETAEYSKETNKAMDCFTTIYSSLFNHHFPEKRFVTSRRNTPRHDWMSKGLVKCCIKKGLLYKKYKKSGTDADKLIYSKYQTKF